MSRRNPLPQRRTPRQLQLESLEDRRVMATSASIVGGVLEVRGTNAAETITISESRLQIGRLQVLIRSATGQTTLNRTFQASRVDRIYVAAYGADDVVTNNTNLPSDLYGGRGNNTVTGGSGNDRIHGWYDRDTLKGRGGNDELFGYGNDDVISGGEGHDWIEGGDGRDSLSGDNGDDMIWGQGHGDELFGGIGSDFLDGGTGDDYLSGSVGNDTMFGGLGDDELHGGVGSDWMWGDGEFESSRDGHDTMFGDDGNDRMYGMGGNDELDGGFDHDTLEGGSGNDTLKGNDGEDVLHGGAGSDSFDGGLNQTDAIIDVMYFDALDWNVDGLPGLVRSIGAAGVTEGRYEGSWIYEGHD